MMRSLYSAVSGLRNHQTRMDVVANNISNVNTVGFKASRVIFQDVYSQTSRSASAASGTSLGGTNPIQIGLGLKLATIDVLHNPAATQRTDNPLDIAIEGEGFFVVREGTKTYYTRAGNFYVDNVGNLVTSSGAFVQGAKSLNSIIDKLSSLFGTGDTEEWADILAAAPAGAVTGGNLAQLKTQMDTVRAALATASSAPTATNINTLNTVVNTLRGYIPTATTATATPEETKALADLKALWQTPTGTIQSALNDFSVANATKGSADANLILDKSDITGLNDYINIAIDDAGVITGIPRNSPTGSKIIIGQLALGTFVNPAGLEKKGNSLYAESSNSGSVLLEHSGHGSAGKMNVGGLEMSNVDLSGEFTDMIITQRGFQANSRVITVSDTLLEELINLKR